MTTAQTVQFLALQVAVAALTLIFGLVALRIAPRPGTSTRSGAWFLAGVAFTLDGLLGTLHAMAGAVVIAAAESGTPFFDGYLRLLPLVQDARALLVLGFAAGLVWVMMERPVPTRRVALGSAAGLVAAGFAVGLVEGPPRPGGAHFSLLTLLGIVSAVLLLAALFLGMMRGRVDRLLWTALAFYAAQSALWLTFAAVLEWAGFGGGLWPVLAIKWAAMVVACVMLACSMRRLRVERVMELPLAPPLYHPPAHRLLGWASFLFSRRDMEEVIEPAVTDMRTEYSDALVAGHRAHAGWIRVRGTYGILTAAGLLIVARIGRQLVTVWRLIGKV
jgi:hypothetical protein